MEIRLDKNGTVILEKLKIALKQIDAEINRRYGKATQEELDFLQNNPTIDLSTLGLNYGND